MENLFNYTARFINTNSLCATMEVVSSSFEACKKTAFAEVKRYHEDATIIIYDKHDLAVGIWHYKDGRIKR